MGKDAEKSALKNKQTKQTNKNVLVTLTIYEPTTLLIGEMLL